MQNKHSFSWTLFISAILHFVVIGVICIGAWTRVNQISTQSQGSQIEAIMVDANVVSKQYDRIAQQRKASINAENKRKEEQDKIEKDLLLKQQQEQQRLKEIEKTRLQAQEDAKRAEVEKQSRELAKKQAEEARRLAEEEAKRAQIEMEKQRQLAFEARKREEEEAKQRHQAALAEKQRIEQEIKVAEEKKKAQQEAAAKAEQARLKAEDDARKAQQEAQKKQAELKKVQEEQKKQAAEAAERKKQEQQVQDIIGGITSQGNRPKDDVNKAGTGASESDIDSYKGQILDAIQNKFKDPMLYIGKVCTLQIKLAPDGLLLDVKVDGGDPALCREAVTAIKMANIPAPKNKAIYERFKDSKIDFIPD